MPTLFTGPDYSVPPAANEIEVTVIGPGYGEAILVHVGDDQWIIVDSCMPRGANRPAPLRYLDDIGVDPSKVFAVVASHWDDDHVRGLSAVLATCVKADFVLSKAFGDKAATIYMEAFDTPLTTKLRSGVREMRTALRELQQSGRTNLKAATPARRLYCGPALQAAHAQPIEIWTLSPADEEYENFLAWIGSEMPTVNQTRRVAMARKNNDLSVVTFISVGGDAILLGGDLEEEGKSTTGWSALIGDPGRPPMKASLLKVAHHGSHNGDHPGIWSDLVTAEVASVVAPFKRGKVSLPTPDDRDRILQTSSQAFATIPLAGRATKRRDPTVEKSIRESTKNFVAAPQTPGMVRFRKAAGTTDAWQEQLFGGAVHLSKVHT